MFELIYKVSCVFLILFILFELKLVYKEILILKLEIADLKLRNLYEHTTEEANFIITAANLDLRLSNIEEQLKEKQIK